MRISVVIQTFCRPDFLSDQLRSIKNQSLIPDEIIISHTVNDLVHTDEFDFKGHEHVIWHQDPGTHTKLLAALSASNEYVAIFDDDALPGKKALESLASWFDEQKGIYTSYGMNIFGDYYQSYWPREQNPEVPEPVHFAGQTWFLRKNWIRHFWNEPFPKEGKIKSGEDLWLSYQCWKKGIRTYVAPHIRGQKETWFQKKSLSTGERALYNREDEHENIRERIVKIARANGYHWAQPTNLMARIKAKFKQMFS